MLEGLITSLAVWALLRNSRIEAEEVLSLVILIKIKPQLIDEALRQFFAVLGVVTLELSEALDDLMVLAQALAKRFGLVLQIPDRFLN